MTDNWQPMATAPRDEPVMLRIRADAEAQMTSPHHSRLSRACGPEDK